MLMTAVLRVWYALHIGRKKGEFRSYDYIVEGTIGVVSTRHSDLPKICGSCLIILVSPGYRPEKRQIAAQLHPYKCSIEGVVTIAYRPKTRHIAAELHLDNCTVEGIASLAYSPGK